MDLGGAGDREIAPPAGGLRTLFGSRGLPAARALLAKGAARRRALLPRKIGYSEDLPITEWRGILLETIRDHQVVVVLLEREQQRYPHREAHRAGDAQVRRLLGVEHHRLAGDDAKREPPEAELREVVGHPHGRIHWAAGQQLDSALFGRGRHLERAAAHPAAGAEAKAGNWAVGIGPRAAEATDPAQIVGGSWPGAKTRV